MNDYPPSQNAVIDTAIEHFQEFGFRGTKLGKVAKESGMKKKELMEKYPDKDVLFRDVFLELYGRIAPQLQDIMDADMPIFDKIRHFTNEYVSFE